MIKTRPTPSAHQHSLLIGQLLHTPLTQTPTQEIVYGGGSGSATHRNSYADFHERISKLASSLAEFGIGHGDTVGVMDWDSHRYLECFFAVPMMGAVLHTINIRLSPEEILYTINHAEDDVILVHRDFMPVIHAIRKQFTRPIRIVELANYETMLASAATGFNFLSFDENTRATTFYTTGTTGAPKGVYFSHRQLMLHTLGFLGALGWTGGHARFHRDDVYMPITPMFHVHGWGIPYIATLMGVKQVYPGRYDPEALLDLIANEGVTFSHCVPTILHMLLSHPRAASIDLSNWKVVIGGSALPRGLARQALNLGIDVFTGYGMSETCPMLTAAQLTTEMLAQSQDEQIEMRCKTGRPAPLVEIRVVDADMNDVERDDKATGEVIVRAPWLTMSYLKETERSEELWSGGYLHTGDIATVDAKGYLQVTDRIKDVIKSGGEWISSLELEGIISQCAGVSQVAVIGIAHQKWGERPLALIVKNDDTMVDEKTVKHHIQTYVDRGELSQWAMPERVDFISQIALTSVGKIDKKKLRELFDH